MLLYTLGQRANVKLLHFFDVDECKHSRLYKQKHRKENINNLGTECDHCKRLYIVWETFVVLTSYTYTIGQQ